MYSQIPQQHGQVQMRCSTHQGQQAGLHLSQRSPRALQLLGCRCLWAGSKVAAGSQGVSRQGCCQAAAQRLLVGEVGETQVGGSCDSPSCPSGNPTLTTSSFQRPAAGQQPGRSSGLAAGQHGAAPGCVTSARPGPPTKQNSKPKVMDAVELRHWTGTYPGRMPRPPAQPGRRASWRLPAASLAPAQICGMDTRAFVTMLQTGMWAMQRWETRGTDCDMLTAACSAQPVPGSPTCLITAAPESREMPRPRRNSRTSLPLFTLQRGWRGA